MDRTQEDRNEAVAGNQTVTDDDLHSALADAMAAAEESEASTEGQESPQEEPVAASPHEEPAPSSPTIPDEPEDPALRSKLGQKVKWLDKELKRLRDEQAALLAQKTQAPTQAQPQRTMADEEIPEFITTPDELEKYLAIREAKRNREVQGYQMGYAQTFLEMGREDDLYEEVEKEMMEKFNTRHTGNPSVDAQINYAKAQASVYRRKLSTPQQSSPQERKPVIPGRRDNPQGAGVTIASRNARPANAPPPLDEHAAHFVRSVGMKEDSVAEALGGLRKR